MTQEEKIKDLEQRLALMDADNSALAVELAHFKKVAAGYKGRNAKFQEEVKKLKEQVSHYKKLDLEGDGLYEAKIAELDEARNEIKRLQDIRNDVVPKRDIQKLEEKLESKNAFIEQLQEKAQNLMIDNSNLKGTVDMNESVIKELEETIDELSKPWWKKLFR